MNSEFNISVGKRIREARKNLGYSAEKLGGFTGLSEKFIYKVENGKMGISAENIYELSKCLGVSTDYLVAGERNLEKYESITRLLNDLSAPKSKHIMDIMLNIIELAKIEDKEYAII